LILLKILYFHAKVLPNFWSWSVCSIT